MQSPRSLIVVLVTLALIGVGSLASSHPHDDDRGNKGTQEREVRGGRSPARISLDQAVAMAERRFNARVVRAESREEGNRVVYVLRLLNDSGRVWTIKIDAASGAAR